MGATELRGLQPRAEAQAARAPSRDDDILRLLGRFGLARADQIARQTGRRLAAVERTLRALTAGGLLHPVPVASGGQALVAVALTAAGQRRLPALLPKQRVTARQADVLLAVLDLAWEVEQAAAGRWLPWLEAARAGQVLPLGDLPPPAEGLLLPRPTARGGAAESLPLPVCVVLTPQPQRALRLRLATAARAAGTGRVALYAPPRLSAELRRQTQGLGVTVIDWTPPDPGGRGGAAGPAAPPPRSSRSPVTPKRARALQLLTAFGYATVDQVARAQGTHSTAASIMLAAMEKAGLVQRHRQHHLHKDVYSPTPAGAAGVGLGLPPVPRVPAQRRHALALLDLAHDLVAETGGRWETQRQIAARLGLQVGASRQEVPDGLLVLSDGRRLAVELELSSQPRHAVLDFIAAQLRGGHCDEVCYVVAPEWQRRYVGRLEGVPGASVRGWKPPDRLGGPRGFRADRVTREPAAPRILGRGRRGPGPPGA